MGMSLVEYLNRLQSQLLWPAIRSLTIFLVISSAYLLFGLASADQYLVKHPGSDALVALIKAVILQYTFLARALFVLRLTATKTAQYLFRRYLDGIKDDQFLVARRIFNFDATATNSTSEVKTHSPPAA